METPISPFKSLPRLLRLLAVFSLALLFTGCNEVELYSKLDEKEANEMIALMQTKGIRSTKTAGEENTYTISVPASSFSDAVALLKTNGYPRDKFADIGETFKKSGLVSSPTEERIRFMHALSESLAETITHIDGVVTARVHIVLPSNDPLSDNVLPSSAAVFIKYRNGSDVESSIPQIKNLVVNSIEGVSYDKVSVALFPSLEITPRQVAMSPVRVLFVQVSPESVGKFWLLIVLLLILALVPAGFLGWQYKDKLPLFKKGKAA